MAHDMEFVEQDGRIGSVLLGGGTKGLPHVHDRQTDATALLLTQPGVELAHAFRGAVLTTEPDRPAANQVADHDAVGMAFPDGESHRYRSPWTQECLPWPVARACTACPTP